MGEEIESSYNTSSNAMYQAGTALQIRLETSQLIENIEMFLKGSVMVLERKDNGEIISRTITKGKPKANALGVQSILNWIQMIINPQVVQGNFPAEQKGLSTMYQDYVYNVRVDMMNMLILNCYDWEILDDDIEMIIDSVLNLIEPFMTRLIDNKERESYDNTVKHLEHSSIKESDSNKMKLFG